MNLEAQPRLGPPTSEAEATIVAFEDPSCPVCRIFEERTFPKLRTELLDTGTVAFFAREYPIVAPWGKTASRALEAVFARDGDAFWGLRSYYYAHQGEIVSDVLYDHTRRYLEDDTSLNVERVLGEVRRGGHEAAVRLDSTAAKDAGVKGTPTFLLFESGEYLTEIAGAPSYGMLENALDV